LNLIEDCNYSIFILCCRQDFNATRNNWWALDCFLFIIQSTHHPISCPIRRDQLEEMKLFYIKRVFWSWLLKLKNTAKYIK